MVVTTRSCLETSATAATTRSAAADARLTTIDRAAIRVGQEMELILVVWRDLDPKVIVRAPSHRAIGAHHLPVLTTIV